MNTWTINESRTRLVCACGKLRLRWDKSNDGMAFAAMESTGTGGFTFGAGSPLWKVELRDRQGYLLLLDGRTTKGFSRKGGRTLRLRWAGLADGKVDVVIEARADADAPVTRWRFDLVNRSADHTVWSITFPSLTDVLGKTGSHRQDQLILTDGFGSVIPDPIRRGKLTAWTNRGYPNGLQSLALVAVTNGPVGLYVGTHDPGAGLQRFNYLPDRAADRLPLEVLIEAPDAGRCQRRVRLDYDTVLGLFKGDWYDLAQLHRPAAISQKWAKQTVEARRDIPQWASTIPLWVRIDIGNQPQVAPAEIDRRAGIVAAFRAALGCDIGAHLYQWHDHPFDIDYPAYRPRPGIKHLVKRLQSSGVHVMPYINGRLFDPDNRDWQRERAERYATQGANPKLGSRPTRIFNEVYNSMTPMAVMCPATRYWQDKIAGTVERLVRDLDIDGIYIDQVAAAWSEVCSDPAHGHPLRGGPWWVQAYEQMLDRTQQRVAKLGKQILITTECNADAYMAMFGGLLMVHGIRDCVVPLYSAIYGGRVPLFGRTASLNDRLAFRTLAAQNILWGCQTGWFGLDDMEKLLTPAYRADLAFLQGLCGLWAHLRPYIQAGRMLRPPAIEGAKESRVVWKFCGEWPEVVPTAWAAHWALDGGSAMAVVNVHDRPQRLTVQAPRAKHGDRPSVWWSTPESGQASFAGERAQLEMPPLSAAMTWFSA